MGKCTILTNKLLLHFEIFLKFLHSEDKKSYDGWHFMMQLVYPVSGDNKLAPFHLW